MSAIAHEVSRRMTPEYAKERAREMARYRAEQVKGRAVESSWFGPLLGAGIGALVAKALVSRAQDRREERWFDLDERGYRTSRYSVYGYDEPRYGRPWDDAEERAWDAPREEGGEGLADRAGDVKDRIAERAAGMKERAGEKAQELSARLRDTKSAVAERIPDRERIRQSTSEDTGVWAFGALALGALFGFALPVSQRERELLEPAKQKLREAGQQAKELAIEKGSQAMDQAKARVEGGDEEERDEPSPLIVSPNEPPPLH